MALVPQRLTAAGPGGLLVTLVVVASAVLALALLPVAGRPGPMVPGIVALFSAVILVTELSTSFLLLVRFRAVPSWSLLLLGCAYFYSGLMPIPQLLTFPGAVLADRPLVDTSLQSTSWLFILWINGFSLLSLIAVSLEARSGNRRVAAEHVGRAIVFGLCLTAVAALAVVIIAVAAPDQLPPLVSGQRFTDLNLLASYLALFFLAVSIAIVLLEIGERNRIFLWLVFALTAMAFANIVSTTGGGRFALGWTIGRLSWLISACVLFIYLLVLHSRDQDLWTKARDLLGGDTGPEVTAVWSDAATQTPKAMDAALESFVARSNVIRYKRMLEEPHDEATRQVLLRMLADEERRVAQAGSSAH